jgi:hypothetical protein
VLLVRSLSDVPLFRIIQFYKNQTQQPGRLSEIAVVFVKKERKAVYLCQILTQYATKEALFA